jgi:hypothetical protein
MPSYQVSFHVPRDAHREASRPTLERDSLLGGGDFPSHKPLSCLAMSYAGPGGNVGYITRTAPHDGFHGRSKSNPTGHASMVASPLPYRQEDPAEPETRYCDEEVNGVIPGYGGHRPRAQHCYGRTAFGDPKGISHAGELRKKSLGKLERGGEDAFASGFANGEGIDGAMKGHPDTKADAGVWAEGVADYSVQVGGILPGYAGHVPRSIHKYGASSKGNTPQFHDSQEHAEVEELRKLFSRQPEVAMIPEGGDLPRSDPNDDGEDWWPKAPPSAAIEGKMTDFRDQINGVLPRYAGHVPRGKDKYGASHYGKTRTVPLVQGSLRDIEQRESNSGVEIPGAVMGQVNRMNSKAEVTFQPTQRIDGNGVVPGYRGHVPNVGNAIGMSTFLSGPGFTEVLVENMEKMGGAGDLGDSAAAYGCNDWGASGFSDGAAEMADMASGPMADGHASSLEKSSMAAAGHIDMYTIADADADRAEAAKKRFIENKIKHDEAKRIARGF